MVSSRYNSTSKSAVDAMSIQVIPPVELPLHGESLYSSESLQRVDHQKHRPEMTPLMPLVVTFGGSNMAAINTQPPVG